MVESTSQKRHLLFAKLALGCPSRRVFFGFFKLNNVPIAHKASTREQHSRKVSIGELSACVTNNK